MIPSVLILKLISFQSCRYRSSKASKQPDSSFIYKKIIKSLPTNSFFKRKCSQVGIDANLFKLASLSFVKKHKQLQIPKVDMSSKNDVRNTILKMLIQHVKGLSNDVLSSGSGFYGLMEKADLSIPLEWYPQARAIKRKIILHVGPTNSGKTYHALKKFQESSDAVFCGPLRLLAHEIYEKCNANNVACNLLTGEEKRESEGINRWSSTVEMANLSQKYQIAVIDEIQMISDFHRGWAWTQALLGLQAEEIHCCGEPGAINLVKKVLEGSGDSIEVIEYDRLSGLQMDTRPILGFEDVVPGDCVVAFSRKNVFKIKKEIEEKTDFRAAVVYGALPPESRAEQAKLFNSQQDNFKVLVATDAIGMGLNLHIGRVIFHSTRKFNGSDMVPLSISQTKQIAGRAGRFNSAFQTGLVTAMHHRDMKFVQNALQSPMTELKAAGVLPTLQQLEKFQTSFPNEPFNSVLLKFEQIASTSGNYFLCNLENQISIAEALNHINLKFPDRYTFIMSPTKYENKELLDFMIEFADKHSKSQKVVYEDLKMDYEIAGKDLVQMETDHKIVILYMWLGLRFPDTFPDGERVEILKTQIEENINEVLTYLGGGESKMGKLFKKVEEFYY